MIQTRNQYLQFMLVMLAAWGISWGSRFVMEQAVLLYGPRKNYLFFSHGAVLMYLLCVFLVYRRWIAPLPVVGQLRNVVNATMFDRYLPFSCPLNTFVTDAVRFAPFHHH